MEEPTKDKRGTWKQQCYRIFSNSESTSGPPVIAGYILPKAPCTTHRLRYTQYLRSKFPESTPFFDVYFHRQSPIQQCINHLAIQCVRNQVHTLIQNLLTVSLDGSGVGVYVQRCAFARISTVNAGTLFENMTYSSNLFASSSYPIWLTIWTVLKLKSIRKIKQLNARFGIGNLLNVMAMASIWTATLLTVATTSNHI